MSEQSTSTNEPMEDSHAEDSQAAIDQAIAESSNSSLEQQLAEAQRSALLAQAELENFRKRMQRDNEQALKYANLPLVRDLLDVIDNLNRATESAKNDTANSESSQALLAGVAMVSMQFAGVLAKYGCRPIETAGKQFDPNVHQAISQMPSNEIAAGMVAQEVAVGYMLHDRVVRPSCVIVSTGAPQE